MPEIIALLQTLSPVLAQTPLRQLSHVLYGMLISTGRLTMLELSRWTEAGGSYRTIQRLYHTPLPWAAMLWTWFTQRCWNPTHEYILAGDGLTLKGAATTLKSSLAKPGTRRTDWRAFSLACNSA